MNATTDTTSTVYVDPYPGRKGSERIWSTCAKCGGSGSVSWGIEVDAVVSGRVVSRVCFDCNGVGSTSHLVSSARATARRQAREAAAAAARAEAYVAEQAAKKAEADAKRAEFAADHGDVVDWITANAGRSSFAESLADTLDEYAGLSEKQVAAVRSIIADDETKAPVVEGRIVVTGRIVSTRYVEPYAYGQRGTYKMRVRDDRGFTVYGSIPQTVCDALYDEFYAGDRDPRLDGPAVWSEAAKGRRVTFTATVEASDDDEAFGFFKRPTKAALVD